MKFLAVLLLACFVALAAGQARVSSNNFGDLTKVDVNADARIDSNIDATIVGIALRFFNYQRITFRQAQPQQPNLPNLPNLPLPNPRI